MKPNEVYLPVAALGLFVKAAHQWLSRAQDAKNGLEIRLAHIKEPIITDAGTNIEAWEGMASMLEMSVGADSCFMSAKIMMTPESLEALKDPIFLDMTYLANYAFEGDTLTMVVPQTAYKDDQRIQFKAPGINFRLPRKNGAVWRLNEVERGQASPDTPTLTWEKSFFDAFWPRLTLPNSFNIDKANLQLTFSMPKEGVVEAYCSDGAGAFYHSFEASPDAFKSNCTSMSFLAYFFGPLKTFHVDQDLKLRQNDRLCLAETFLMENAMTVWWAQPRFQKIPDAVPLALNQARLTSLGEFTLQPRELLNNLDRATMFMSPADAKNTPLEFCLVSDQYTLSTRRMTDEVQVDGKVQQASQNLDVVFKAGCLKDYLNEFEKTVPIKMEVLGSSALAIQTVTITPEDPATPVPVKRFSLMYWMPVLPKIIRSSKAAER